MPSSTLEQGIGVKLLAITGMAGYTTRCYWISAPDGATMPYMTYRLIDSINLNGIVGADKDQEALVQVSLWGTNQYNLLAMSNLIINELEGFTGNFDGKNILFGTTRGPRQLRDPEFNNVYQFIIDVTLTFVR